MVSVVTLGEALIKPIGTGDTRAVRAYQGMLRPAQGIACRPVTRMIATRAALLRAAYPSLRTPDALCVATAMQSNCDAFLTNDERLGTIQEIPVLVLQQLTL